MSRTLRAAFGLIACVLSALAHSQIYKWVDAQGTTHYESQPPPQAGAKTQTLAVPASNPSASSGSESWADKSNAFQARYDKKKADEAKLEQQQGADAAARAANCTAARNRLNFLLAAGPIYNRDANGEKVYYSDDQKLQAINDMRANVARYCSE